LTTATGTANRKRNAARQRPSARQGPATRQRQPARRDPSYLEYFSFLRPRLRLQDYFAKGGFDMTFFILVVTLLTIGLVMMFSASYVYSMYTQKGDPYYYISRQLLYAAGGMVVLFLVSKIHYTVFKDFAFLALLISFGLLIYVLINPHVIAGKEDFKRWIWVPLLNTTIQPSEIAKIGLVLYCSWGMERKQKLIAKKWWMMLPYAAVIGLMCLLVYKENHLSGTILIFLIGIVMTYLGGVKTGWYVLAAVGVAAVALFVIANPDVLQKYAGTRIQAWLDEDYDPQGDRWQINQSLYAIGSGGLFGAGLGQSRQKHLYIPEPQNDFVFSVVCEELGFIGAFTIIILFVLLVWRGFVIALRAKDRFSSLLVMGICFQVGLQAALNIAVVTGTVPNTGISLPFFSYGGTSLMILLIEMGMVLSVSRYSKIPKM